MHHQSLGFGQLPCGSREEAEVLGLCTRRVGVQAPRCRPKACLCVLSCFSCVQLFATLRADPVRLLCPWDSPGKNTRVGCHALLQGLFPTQGWNLRFLQLLHCRILYY